MVTRRGAARLAVAVALACAPLASTAGAYAGDAARFEAGRQADAITFEIMRIMDGLATSRDMNGVGARIRALVEERWALRRIERGAW